MCTIHLIDALHARPGSAENVADDLRSLAAIGMVRFESFIIDGHSEFQCGRALNELAGIALEAASWQRLVIVLSS